MAVYRNVSLSFWTDPKIDDHFTPEDKYFYLYLLTNPHTNLLGCYEISFKQMERETGYNIDTVNRLLTRMELEHDVIRFDRNTHEVLVLNWHKYNWTASDKVIKAVEYGIPAVKSAAFQNFLRNTLNGDDTVSIPYEYGMDTTVTVTDTVTDTVSVTDKKKPAKKKTDIFADFAAGDDDLLSALRDFEKMRLHIKKPLEDVAKRRLISRLEKEMPRDQWIEALENAIEHNWLSVYPPRENASKNKVKCSQPKGDRRAEVEEMLKELAKIR